MSGAAVFHQCARAVAAVALLALMTGCAMVKVQSRNAGDYVALTRGDVLSTGKLSQSGQETLRVAGLDLKRCRTDAADCATALDRVEGVDIEHRLATQAELWTVRAMALTDKRKPGMSDAALQAWLESARHAYAYLFFTERSPRDRAFENRQTQVRDYYNYAVQQVVESLFASSDDRRASASGQPLQMGPWRVRVDMSAFRLPGGVQAPKALFAASSLRFEGLRSTYRRDGFGAELVAEVSPEAVGDPAGLALLQPPAALDPAPRPRCSQTSARCRTHRPRCC